MKKILLSGLILICCLNTIAQTNTQQINRCGTKIPSQQWDEMFNQMVSAYKSQHATARMNGANTVSSTSTFTIPVIIHVIHGGEAVGTFPNLSQSQINSQITVLNQDYSGTGMGVSSYTALSSGGHGPFYDYAQAYSLPAPDNTNAGITVANTGITFVLATKDTNGNVLPEPGIERINYNTMGWNNPTTYTTVTTFQNYIDGTIKLATIWNATKYFNIWITDESSDVGLLGYSTFPDGSGITGISTPYGTSTNDGMWMYSKAVGSIDIEPTGVYIPTYCYGRTATHNVGYYLGLRNTWGDGTCASDYCNDTPPEKTGTYYGIGTGNSSYIYPYTTNTCTASGNYNSDDGDGIMYMNFMDYSDDAYMCMFTNDQTTRMQTAMTNCPYRNGLTASAIAMGAASTITTPTAAFAANTVCMGLPVVTIMDASAGNPTSWLWTVSPSTGITPSSSTLQNLTFTVSTAGSYSITLVATNSNGSDSVTHTIVAETPTVSFIITPDGTPHVWDVTPSITGISPFNYTWDWGDGTYNDTLYASHTYSMAGNYNLCLTAMDAAGCVNSYCETDSLYRTSQAATIIQINVVNSTSGINQVSNSKNQFSVYPNPVSTLLYISGIKNQTEIQVYDVLGNVVIQNTNTQIDVSNLPSGVYFVRASNSVQKFVKQ